VHWTSAATNDFLPKRIPPVRVSLVYRLGLLGVGIALLLLQLIYVAMVIASVCLTILYALALPAVLERVHFNAITMVFLVIPFVTGGVVTFFLFKPLLSRRPKEPELRRLDPADEPELYEFVRRLCWAVGARAPKQILVDTNVNASASLYPGWIGLFTGNLTLTIGLPLGGLTLRQFAGVLAHEFGHFSQRAGMRLYFLIGTIRLWFARVAYERDSWDEQLDQMRENSGWRMKLVLHVAAGAVWVSRAILRGLLHGANWVSAWFSRQMEFDADRYEASLVGAAVFEQTTHRLAVLEPLAQDTWQMVGDSWELRRLPEDFPMMVLHRDRVLDPEVRQTLIEAALKVEAERWSTHPAPKQRIASVAGIEGIVPRASGAFPEDLAAEVLFADFSRLCREVTRTHYDQLLEGRSDEATLVPAHQVVEELDAGRRRRESIVRCLGPLQMASQWFRLPVSMQEEGGGAEQRKDEHGEVTMTIAETDESSSFAMLLQKSISRNTGLRFLQAGRSIDPQSFQLASRTLEGASIEAAQIREELDRELVRLRERFAPQGTVLEMYGDPVLYREYQTFTTAQDLLIELRFEKSAFDSVRANIHVFDAAGAHRVIEASLQTLRDLTKQILDRLGEPLCNRLLPGMSAESRVKDPEELARLILPGSERLGEELLGDLCGCLEPILSAPPEEAAQR
jgi:Zn-dependent protease with chaperone function